MSDLINKYVVIFFQETFERSFKYEGKVIGDDPDFLTLQDKISGLIKLKKDRIVKIQMGKNEN